MRKHLETIQDYFKIGYEAFEDSREEEKKVRDLYHNRQFNEEQEYILNKRGQPLET